MSMVIKNNMPAVMTLGTLNHNSMELSKSLQKVSSGMKINSAADDASGYAISERMRVQIRGLDQANLNTQNGISMLKVAEGAVSSTVDILKTLKEKVINAANDTNTDSDRQIIQKELDQSIDQINDNANVTYNGKYLVDGSKNAKGEATYTALTNTMLSPDTQAGTALTNLKNRNGDSLGILSSDSVTVSYVQEGKTYTTTFAVGNKSLQKIFVEAEAVEPTTITFGDLTNPSIANASGIDPSDLETVKTELWNDYQTKLQAWQATQGSGGTVATKKSALDNANAKLANYDTQYAIVTGKLEVLDNEAEKSTFTSPANSATWINSCGDFTTDYNNWKTTSGDPPNSSVVRSATTGETTGGSVKAILNSPSTATFATDFKNAFSSYETEYNTLSSYGSRSSLVDAIDAAQQDYDAAVADAANKKSLSDQALAQYDALFGAKLLEEEKLGMDRSGNTVTTANGENAITVTASDSGLQGQIAGLTISVTDSQGNVKKSVNSVLDAFNESIRAEEASEENAIVLQTGTKANQSIKVGLSDMRARALGLQGSDGSTLNIGTQKNANAAINVLDNAVQKALDQQTTIGSIQSRLEYTSANLTTATENVQASESTIRDANMPKEMTEFTKNNILMQASQAMLAQANQSSSDVLSLLR